MGMDLVQATLPPLLITLCKYNQHYISNLVRPTLNVLQQLVGN